ncbi:methylenetetrahydrofolate reductase C-terminal domain-containing protein [Thermococcus indicus]|uniref:methylenetetrahydrofolate reductase C-terminal domain-containing protein n=1 Tax=Thermococcus indicus TaxID=2586643 RepID=UPI001F0F82ED|nr:methylenetetrahydrofolate reductase C-terminal domain-containing protein [Thermococcus indicus]
MGLRLSSCPKGMLNGPCGGALGERCEVDGRMCPLLRRLEVEEAPFEEHPVLREMEKLVEGDTRPRDSAFWRGLELGRALTLEFPISAVRTWEDVHLVVGSVRDVDLLTVPDNPLGYPHFEPTAMALYLKSLGRPVCPHLTGKDRNLTAVASELRTALLFGFEAVLMTTGDWPGLSLPSRPVFDLDSANLIRLARLVFAGILPTGERFEADERPRVLGTINPHYRPALEAKRVLRKLVAGAEALVTQVVASKESLSRLKEVLRSAGGDVPVLVSLLHPLTEELRPALERMGIPAGDEGFEELLEEVKTLDFVSGINLIVFSRSLEGWLSLATDAVKTTKEVFE